MQPGVSADLYSRGVCAKAATQETPPLGLFCAVFPVGPCVACINELFSCCFTWTSRQISDFPTIILMMIIPIRILTAVHNLATWIIHVGPPALSLLLVPAAFSLHFVRPMFGLD